MSLSFLSTFTIPVPFLGSLYVELDATDAFRGRLLQGSKYHGETFVRIAFIHAIWTPRNWSLDHGERPAAHPVADR